MSEEQFRFLAAQLRQPHGEHAQQVAERMNINNRPMYETVFRTLQPEAGQRILEIGMGNGAFTNEVLALAPDLHYVGCDFSEAMINASVASNVELMQSGKVNFVLSDAAAMPFEDELFDRVFGVNTLYFWEPAKELKDIRRVLKPGGKLLLVIRPAEMMRQLPFTSYGFTMYSKEELKAVLEANGFTVADIVETKEEDVVLEDKVIPSSNLVAIAVKP